MLAEHSNWKGRGGVVAISDIGPSKVGERLDVTQILFQPGKQSFPIMRLVIFEFDFGDVLVRALFNDPKLVVTW